MYLKIKQGSQLYDKLNGVIRLDYERDSNYTKWQIENLPEYNHNVLVRFNPWYIFKEVVAWGFVGEVDKKVWQNFKGYNGYYEPNKRTKAGKTMRTRLNLAQGNRFRRMDFYDILHISMPEGRSMFTIPNAFIYNEVVYMIFGDESYKEIVTKLAGQFEEITRTEWEEIAAARNKF